MKYQIVKDKKKRILVHKNELKRIFVKYLLRKTAVDDSFRLRKKRSAKLAKYRGKGSKVRVNNRCILTGRTKSVHKYYRLSRIALREYASTGLLNGVRKSSW